MQDWCSSCMQHVYKVFNQLLHDRSDSPLSAAQVQWHSIGLVISHMLILQLQSGDVADQCSALSALETALLSRTFTRHAASCNALLVTHFTVLSASSVLECTLTTTSL